MPVSDIYGALTPAPKSVADFDNENLLMQSKRQGLQANALAIQGTQADLQQKQSMLAQRAALGQAIQSGQIDLSSPDPSHMQRALAIAPDVAPAMLKTVQEGLTSRAKAGLDTAQAGEATAKAGKAISDTAIQNTEFMARTLPTVQNPTQLAQWYKSGIDKGLITQEQAQQEFSQIPINDPVAMKQWIQNKTQEGVSTVEKMKLAQQAQIAADQNKTHLTGIGMQQTGENNRAALQRTTQLKINGMDANGNFVGLGPTAAPDPNAPAGAPAPQSPLSAMVDAIGQYKQPAAIVLSRMAPGLKDQVLAQVQAKYPDYDGTQFGARIQAAKAYSAGGKETMGIQAANTALNHLDTIQQLAAAQKNGNYPLFNQIANQIGAQTGQPAPTNLRAAISMVAPELTKAVVGTGGGVAERADFAHNLNPNGSPDQILGGVATIQELMGGRLGEVARTYQRSTGKNDFNSAFLSPAAQRVLASRAGSNAAASVPDDIAAILQKHGAK